MNTTRAVRVTIISALLVLPCAAQDGYMPDLDAISEEVGELRGLEFKRSVPARKQSMEDFTAFVDAEMEGMFDPDRLDGLQKGLLRLGMITEPMDVMGELRDAVLSQAGGYYDPETGTFYYLMADLGPEFLDTIAAHELVHALQDQHYDLGESTDEIEAAMAALPRRDDEVLAYRFLIEGEATYVQSLWQMKAMGMDMGANPKMAATAMKMQADMDLSQLIKMVQAQLPEMGDGGDSIVEAMKQMDNIPPYILYPLYAAYMNGAYFIAELRAQGGWEAIGKLFADLPMSTEQTLHPEKYTDRDRPTPVELGPIASLVDRGWTLADAAVHGEYYLRILLRNFDVARRTAVRAAAGWDGDLYQAYVNDEGGCCIVVATTWDSEEDAGEFVAAWNESRTAKYEGYALLSEGPGRLSYDCGDGTAGVIVRRGRDVHLVEGCDLGTCYDVLLDAMSVAIEHVE